MKKLEQNVLLIDNNDSFTYNLVQLLEQSGACVRVVNSNDDILETAESFDKIMLSPGPDMPLRYENMMKVIDRYHRTKNILGICLGHQALGVYFGMNLKCADFPFHGVMSELVITGSDEIYHGLPERLFVGRYHSWVIEDSDDNDEFIITARDCNGLVMAMRHKHYNLRGFQFHPESVMTPYGNKIINNWLTLE